MEFSKKKRKEKKLKIEGLQRKIKGKLTLLSKRVVFGGK